MSSGSSRKKRLSLHDIVDKLSLGVLEKVSEDVQIEEVKPSDEPSLPLVQEKRSSTHRLHLAKAFAAPGSPDVSESSAEDAPISDKEIIEDELPKESGPIEPMRCGVCGLRVFKSYRYISRSSAPMHLKMFFDPDTDRFRVCKRCFSSKERCRQNLALLLLKSQTQENTHLRSPLGITQGRRTQGLKYIFRDIGKSLKRPYEDLICDETFDEDYLSDGDENIPLKAVKKEPVSAKKFNSDVEKLAGSGVVTVVRPSSNTYQIYPNHLTIYGELNQNKTIEADGKPEVTKDLTLIKTNNKLPEEETRESDDKDGVVSTNVELKSEIRTINYKLTLLDHAYALPAARTVKPYNKPPKPVLENLPKVKNDSVAKAAIKTMIKNNSMIKKLPSASTTENKTGQPSRTCGIICSICKNLVTKSYSCYRKDNAPERIKSYFTGDIKVMKVCRRCVPYKKPKGEVQPSKVIKTKVKILQAKLLKQKIKNAKKASKAEARASKNEISTQTKDKTSQKTTKEETKVKSVEKETKESKKVEASVVHLSPKKDTTVVHVSIKNGKVESTSNNAINTIFPPIRNLVAGNDVKTDSNKLKTATQKPAQKTDVDVKTAANGQQLGSLMLVHLKTPPVEKVLDKEKTGGNTNSVDFGTQPMHSMIGVKKAKSKTSKKDEDSEKKTERKPAKEIGKGADVSKTPEDSKKVVETAKEKEKGSSQAKTENEELKEKEKEVATKEKDKEKEVATKEKDKEVATKEKEKDLKAKNKTEQTTENQTEKGPVRKLNADLQNSKVEGKTPKPMSAKPLIEPVRSSPRRDKNIIPPEKTKKEPESKSSTTTTAVKRKKEISEPESESTKQTAEEKTNTKQNDEKVNEKQSEEKPSEKVEVALKRSTRKGRGMKRKDSESETSSTAGSVDDEKKESKRARSAEAKSMDNDKKTEIPVTNHNYSTRWAQSPIKCGCCHENVVKSYRCIQLGSSPAHLKPVFPKEGKHNLRICRKCLNFPSRVKSFL